MTRPALVVELERAGDAVARLAAARGAGSVFLVLSDQGTAVRVDGSTVTPADPNTAALVVALRAQLERLVMLRDYWTAQLENGHAFVSLAEVARVLASTAVVRLLEGGAR